MDSNIKTIEDLSLNAWPSHQIQIYDGWLLRFSYFYTHRTNSVEQIGSSTLPVSEKVAYCENIYRKWGSPAIFKISPLVDPAFDQYLSDRGYALEHKTLVMVCDLSGHTLDVPQIDRLTFTSFIPSRWIEGLFALKGTTNAMHKAIVPSMYRAIPKDTICVSINRGGRIVATGLGILDRNYVGVYAIHVHPEYRRKHFASGICRTLLAEGRRRGADKAYLQVVEGNTPAISLYSSLGFKHLYSYWFRAKPV